MISVIPQSTLTTADLKVLRALCSLSITQIRTCSHEQKSILDIPIFKDDWDTNKLLLVSILSMLQSYDAPFIILERNEYGLDEELTASKLEIRIRHWRDIELEQQLMGDLENGHINNPDEFTPHDEDWTLVEP